MTYQKVTVSGAFSEAIDCPSAYPGVVHADVGCFLIEFRHALKGYRVDDFALVTRDLLDGAFAVGSQA